MSPNRLTPLISEKKIIGWVSLLLWFLTNKISENNPVSYTIVITIIGDSPDIVNEGVVSKETVVLRRWGSSIQKFGFINGVDNVNWPPYRDSKS